MTCFYTAQTVGVIRWQDQDTKTNVMTGTVVLNGQTITATVTVTSPTTNQPYMKGEYRSTYNLNNILLNGNSTNVPDNKTQYRLNFGVTDDRDWLYSSHNGNGPSGYPNVVSITFSQPVIVRTLAVGDIDQEATFHSDAFVLEGYTFSANDSGRFRQVATVTNSSVQLGAPIGGTITDGDGFAKFQGTSLLNTGTPLQIKFTGYDTTGAYDKSNLIVGFAVFVSLPSPLAAVNDSFTLTSGKTSVISVLANDTDGNNNSPAVIGTTAGTVKLTQTATTNSNVNLDSSGKVVVAPGTPTGTYTITYQICEQTALTNCKSATATVQVYADTDRDGVPDYLDLDNDNDAILDSDEGRCSISANLTWRTTGSDYGSNFNLIGINGSNVNVAFTSSFFNGATAATNIGRPSADGISFRTQWTRVAIPTSQPLQSAEYAFTFSEEVRLNDFAVKDLDREHSFIDAVKFRAEDKYGNPVNLTVTAGANLTQDVNGYWYAKVFSNSSDANAAHWLTVNSGGANIKKLIVIASPSVGGGGYSPGSPATVVNDPSRFIFGNMTICAHLDTDADGIPDYLDLDSDKDGCPDAGEGGANFEFNTLETASGAGATQTPNKNLGINVDSNGVPTRVGAGGQGIGSSKDDTINSCFCYNTANTATAGTDTKHGITLLQRAGAGAKNTDWPMVRKSAHTVLESNTKGFVITRMTTTQIGQIVSPQDGMMVYDTTSKCLKLFDGSAWNCFSVPSCPL